MKRIHLLTLTQTLAPLALIACAPDLAAVDTTGTSADHTRTAEYQTWQGTHVTGGSLPGVAVYFSGAYNVSGNLVNVSLSAGQLIGDGGASTGKQLIDTIFPGTTDPTITDIRIYGAELHLDPYPGLPSFSNEWEYQVAYTDAQGSHRLCGNDPNNPDNWAMAVPGAWHANGDLDVGAESYTFACRGSVVVKCIDWQYKPWKSYSGTTLAGKQIASQPGVLAPGEPLHHACTRMARADYCGNGDTHTVDGTKVDIYDLLGKEQHVAASHFYFEAAWKTNLSTKNPNSYHGGGAVCLSKLRWSTLPIHGYCPVQLPDPRVDRGTFCDDLLNVNPVYRGGQRVDSAALEARGALLFDFSQFVDAGLYTFYNPTSDDYYTTATTLGLPPPGYESAINAKAPAGFQGAVYNRTLPPPSGTVPLFSYSRDSGGTIDHLTTTLANPGAGFTSQLLEGYVSPPSLGGNVTLSRYANVATPHYLTTTSNSVPGSFFFSAVEGYLPR